VELLAGLSGRALAGAAERQSELVDAIDLGLIPWAPKAAITPLQTDIGLPS